MYGLVCQLSLFAPQTNRKLRVAGARTKQRKVTTGMAIDKRRIVEVFHTFQ